MSDSVRVRFAPSPTGPLHIGGVRTALYNYLFARKNGGKFILRIEDTDQTRYVPGAEDYIMESLKWCGLEIDEGVKEGGDYGPYRQSERKGIYGQYADLLVEKAYAYYAFDTPEELDEMRERLKKQGVPSPQYNAVTRQYMKNSLTLPEDEVKARLNRGDAYVIRLKMPRNEEVKFEDLIRGWVAFHTNQLDDKVILKGDGMPTYHLANVVDDHQMRISHVIRGEEWLPSTPTHLLLYRYLGWEDQRPEFAHLPLILRPDGHGKLSKRDGDRLGFPVFPLDWENKASGEKASGFRERGFLPAAFTNMLAFLGWNPGTDQELYTLEELIRDFTFERVGKAGARFDFEKASWFNHQYLMREDDRNLARQALPGIRGKYGEVEEDYLVKVCGLLKERVPFVSQFGTEGEYFFSEDFSYDEKMIAKKWKEENREFFEMLKSAMESLEDFNSENIETLIKSTMEDGGLKFGAVLPVIRLILCGTMAGPPIFDVASLLGKKIVIQRMEKFLEKY